MTRTPTRTLPRPHNNPAGLVTEEAVTVDGTVYQCRRNARRERNNAWRWQVFALSGGGPVGYLETHYCGGDPGSLTRERLAVFGPDSRPVMGAGSSLCVADEETAVRALHLALSRTAQPAASPYTDDVAGDGTRVVVWVGPAANGEHQRAVVVLSAKPGQAARIHCQPPGVADSSFRAGSGRVSTAAEAATTAAMLSAAAALAALIEHTGDHLAGRG